ncbi:MAG: hypothetical protein LUI06_08970 [Ruminococcus sp.]|nr:hypothetical protein [Ruminococcus sp.]
MKKAALLFFRSFIFAVAVTQLLLFLGDLFELTFVRYRITSSVIYLVCLVFASFLQLFLWRTPKLPEKRLCKILTDKGYTPEFYRIMLDWVNRCEKKGIGDGARLSYAETLIDGGHYDKGLAELEQITFSNLEFTQKQIYFNTCLYAAILCGDKTNADRVYLEAQPWLENVKKRSLKASVYHTLGCYEYSCSNIEGAIDFFMKSLKKATTTDVTCEDNLALVACYLETDCPMLAKAAAEEAADYALTLPLKQKVDKAKALVEKDFRNRRGAA